MHQHTVTCAHNTDLCLHITVQHLYRVIPSTILEFLVARFSVYTYKYYCSCCNLCVCVCVFCVCVSVCSVCVCVCVFCVCVSVCSVCVCLCALCVCVCVFCVCVCVCVFCVCVHVVFVYAFTLQFMQQYFTTTTTSTYIAINVLMKGKWYNVPITLTSHRWERICSDKRQPCLEKGQTLPPSCNPPSKLTLLPTPDCSQVIWFQVLYMILVKYSFSHIGRYPRPEFC